MNLLFSMSVTGGPPNPRHNVDKDYRAKLDNTHNEMTPLNVALIDEPVREAYDRLFGDALADYNAAQVAKGHPERVIDDYYDKIENAFKIDAAKAAAGKKRKRNVVAPLNEYVLQIGNMDDWDRLSEMSGGKTTLLNMVYKEALASIKNKTKGALEITQAVIHWDEATPHMHMEYIAYGTGNKRGLETQASMGQALKKLGLRDKPELAAMMLQCLEDAAAAHGIRRTIVGDSHEHLNVREYKQARRAAEDMERRAERERERGDRAKVVADELTAEVADKTARVAELDAQAKQAVATREQAAAELAAVKAETKAARADAARARAEAKQARQELSRLQKLVAAAKDEEGIPDDLPALDPLPRT